MSNEQCPEEKRQQAKSEENPENPLILENLNLINERQEVMH
jgi:hypothetical protein